MVDPVSAAVIGAGAVKAVAGLFGGGGDKKRRKELAKAIAQLRAARPTGYITPEDERAASLTRGRLVEGATATAGHQRSGVQTRYAQRGLAGSPAQERSLGRINDIEAVARQRAGESAEEQLYNVRTGREAFERQKELSIFGAQTGYATDAGRRADLQQSTFANSLLEFMPTILDFYGGGGGSPGGTPRMGQPGFQYPVGSGMNNHPSYDPTLDTRSL